MDFADPFAAFVARLILWSVFFALLTPIAWIFPQGARQPLVKRLLGLVFWGLWIGANSGLALIIRPFWPLIGHPMVRLDLQRLTAWAGPAAGAVSILLSAAFADLVFYWFHRAQHAWPWLWRFHATHHSVRDMSAVNSYHHASEVVIRFVMTALPLSWLSLQAADIPLLVGAFELQVVAIHSPAKFHLGPLRRVLADNRFHRIHHSLEERHFDKNFAANFSLWDVLFGTAYFPAADEWPDTGLAETPEPTSIKDWLLMPVRGVGGAPTSDPVAGAVGQDSGGQCRDREQDADVGQHPEAAEHRTPTPERCDRRLAHDAGDGAEDEPRGQAQRAEREATNRDRRPARDHRSQIAQHAALPLASEQSRCDEAPARRNRATRFTSC
jgi:sterol desaturase/sphingolipid hydroxylase (fatty acid hydroxylase superfamily)